MGIHRNLHCGDDRGNLLVENMFALLLISVALISGTAGVTVLAKTSNSNMQVLELGTELSNDLERRLATSDFPPAGQTVPVKINNQNGIMWSDFSASPHPSTTLGIAVQPQGENQTCTKQSHDHCLVVKGSSPSFIGANVKELKPVANQGTDQYTVQIPAGTTTLHYVATVNGSRFGSILATSYQGTTKLDQKLSGVAYGTGWVHGRIDLAPGHTPSTVGLYNALTTNALSAKNFAVYAQTGG